MTNPPDDPAQTTLATLRAILTLLTQCREHVIELYGTETAPAYALDRAHHTVIKSISLIEKRRDSNPPIR